MDKFEPVKFSRREIGGPIKNVDLEFIILVIKHTSLKLLANVTEHYMVLSSNVYALTLIIKFTLLKCLSRVDTLSRHQNILYAIRDVLLATYFNI